MPSHIPICLIYLLGRCELRVHDQTWTAMWVYNIITTSLKEEEIQYKTFVRYNIQDM